MRIPIKVLINFNSQEVELCNSRNCVIIYTDFRDQLSYIFIPVMKYHKFCFINIQRKLINTKPIKYFMKFSVYGVICWKISAIQGGVIRIHNKLEILG